MAKSLRTLALQLRRNHGVTWIPTFDAGIRPGSVLDFKRWNDVDHIGHLTDDPALAEQDLEVVGPVPCLLADLRRTHEVRLSAALELLQPRPSAQADFQRAKEVVVGFDSPVSYTTSLIRLETVLEADPELWQRPLGQWLKRRRTRVVFQVIRGRLSFLFRGSGAAGVDLQAELANLDRIRLGDRWQWRNEATLESKHEVVLAVETARYRFKHRRFLTV